MYYLGNFNFLNVFLGSRLGKGISQGKHRVGCRQVNEDIKFPQPLFHSRKSHFLGLGRNQPSYVLHTSYEAERKAIALGKEPRMVYETVGIPLGTY